MAWMLCEEALKAVVIFVVSIFLKRVKGAVMNEVCMIPGCVRHTAHNCRGLCLICYGKAKKKVTDGQTTWEKLVKLKLCKEETDPFDDAYARAMEDE